MFDGILADQIRGRPVIEIPTPNPVQDKYGNIILRNKKPQFNISNDGIDFGLGKPSPVRMEFTKRFIVGHERATSNHLAVFFYLANTTDWSRIDVLVNRENEPLLNSAGKPQAILTTHGNRSASRTIGEIADATGLAYGTVQKALKKWEDAEVIWRVKERQRPLKDQDNTGRPVEWRRYEFDPAYVWNGFNWICVGYSGIISKVYNSKSD